MGLEDQIEEREVLDSIFPDEIAGMLPLSTANPLAQFHLIMACQTSQRAPTVLP